MPSIQEKRVFASLPRVERGKGVRLGGDPKNKKNFLYCNGTSVFIRNLKNPVEVDIYTNHAKMTTVARYSPSGFYIASCDVTGKVRIWDTVNKEHILKCEYPVLGGEIRDLAWSPDSQKIAVCGESRGKVAHVFNMDTGTSVGELMGHSKTVNTISFRQTRPFRIVTASEDTTNAFFQGPPFKFTKTQTVHTNFANVARFSPDGKVILCGGADSKLFSYDGEKFDMEKQFGSDEKPVHRGGIYEICFNADSTKALTACGDKTAKIFDVQTGDIEQEFDMSKNPEGTWENMQLGCLWQDDEIITVNGFGHIIYHDEKNPGCPKRIIKGHMKPITALALSEDMRTVFSCSIEGIIYWDVETGDCDNVKGTGHSNIVKDMVIDGNMLFSVGVDDTLRVASVMDKVFTGAELKLKSQPVKLDSLRGTVVVACVNHVMVVDAGCEGQRGDGGLRVSQTLNVDKEPMSVSISSDGVEVAVGFKENEIRIYSMGKGSFSETRKVALGLGEVTCLAYSPNGAFLAYSCGRKVAVRSRNDYELLGRESEMHTARVMSVAWSPNSENFATGALDSNLVVWTAGMDGAESGPTIRSNANSHINKLAWVDPNTIITAGHDSNIKQYTVSA